MQRENEKKLLWCWVALIVIVCGFFGFLILKLTKDNVKDLEYLAMVGSGFVLIPIIGFIRELVKVVQPEQKITAKILEKGTHLGGGRHPTTIYYATFVLADCTRHVMDVDPKIYETLQKLSSGVLYYKELNNKKRFIAFDSNGINPSAQPLSQDYLSFISINTGPIHKNGKRLLRIILFLAAFSIVGIVFAFFTNPCVNFFISFSTAFLATFIAYRAIKKKWKSVSQHNLFMEATVVGKKHRHNDYSITFSLADETTITFIVLHYEYAVLFKGDTGMLTFREKKDSAVFVAFDGIKNIQNEDGVV